MKPGNVHRSLLCERGALVRADGSCRWSQEGSIVMASVTGPRQAPGHKEDAEHAVLDVVFQPWSGSPGGHGKVQGKNFSRVFSLSIAVLDTDTPVCCELTCVTRCPSSQKHTSRCDYFFVLVCRSELTSCDCRQKH